MSSYDEIRQQGDINAEIHYLKERIEDLESRISKESWEDNVSKDYPVLCWVRDDDTMPFNRIRAIIGIEGEDTYKYKTYDAPYAQAVPLTKGEIQRFMDNAPT